MGLADVLELVIVVALALLLGWLLTRRAAVGVRAHDQPHF
jgi:hypothetical protein